MSQVLSQKEVDALLKGIAGSNMDDEFDLDEFKPPREPYIPPTIINGVKNQYYSQKGLVVLVQKHPTLIKHIPEEDLTVEVELAAKIS
jgi:hypothetical protein